MVKVESALLHSRKSALIHSLKSALAHFPFIMTTPLAFLHVLMVSTNEFLVTMGAAEWHFNVHHKKSGRFLLVKKVV